MKAQPALWPKTLIDRLFFSAEKKQMKKKQMTPITINIQAEEVK